MLTMQSRDGRISANGVRAVRQAVLTGEQVQRADVLAIIATYLEQARQVADLTSQLVKLERQMPPSIAPGGGRRG